MTVRSKWKLNSIKDFGSGRKEYQFFPVCPDSKENEWFHLHTPNGDLRITVDNPNVNYEIGKEYYFDSVEAKS